MAVAKKDISEVVAVLRRFLSNAELRALLQSLRNTGAYQRNDSFRITIERVDREFRDQWGQEGIITIRAPRKREGKASG